jgi:hypothetical protein
METNGCPVAASSVMVYPSHGLLLRRSIGDAGPMVIALF